MKPTFDPTPRSLWSCHRGEKLDHDTYAKHGEPWRACQRFILGVQWGGARSQAGSEPCLRGVGERRGHRSPAVHRLVSAANDSEEALGDRGPPAHPSVPQNLGGCLGVHGLFQVYVRQPEYRLPAHLRVRIGVTMGQVGHPFHSEKSGVGPKDATGSPGARSRGMVSLALAPFPSGEFSSVSVPPWPSAICRQRANPIPLPPGLVV